MRMKSKSLLIINSLVVLLLVSGCEAFPASGPSPSAIRSGVIVNNQQVEKSEQTADFKYALVKIDKGVEEAYKNLQRPNNGLWPKMGVAGVNAVNIGDTISVTIFEAQAGGLFIPKEAGSRSGNFVNVPSQTIDASGTISIPFAGDIKVVNRTPTDIGKEISEKLGARAIEPQAIVSVTERRGAEVSVIGAVNNATKFTLGFNGEKLLDAIARAGGASSPAYEVAVTLQRSGKEWSMPLEEIIADPGKNIFLRPKDTVYLERIAKSYQIYGAANLTGTHEFRKSSVTLSEALGSGGGLNDNKADPAEVYVYRKQARDELNELGISIDDSKAENAVFSSLPVIYTLNLRDVQGFFFAQNFQVRDQDVIYIANSEASEFEKFISILNGTSVTKINTHNAVKQ